MMVWAVILVWLGPGGNTEGDTLVRVGQRGFHWQARTWAWLCKTSTCFLTLGECGYLRYATYPTLLRE